MPPAEQQVRTVRLVFLGGARVGKTALIRRFLQERFEPRHTRTVEELHLLECGTESGGALRLEVLDTSGSYSFPAMRALSIRSADAVALVYSAAEPGTLEEVQRLRQEILQLRGDPPPPVTVVANKADLAESGRAAGDAMRRAQDDWGVGFVEASALTGQNVLAVFRDALSRADVPSLLSPAQQRRRATVPQDGKRGKKPPLHKSHSCSVS